MGLDHSWDDHRRSQPGPGPLGREHLDAPHSPRPRSLPSTRWSVSAQPGLHLPPQPGPPLTLGCLGGESGRKGWEGGRGGRWEGGNWRGRGALGRQTQEQLGLAWAGARLEEAC